MAYFRCAHSDEKIPIFSSGGGETLSREFDTDSYVSYSAWAFWASRSR